MIDWRKYLAQMVFTAAVLGAVLAIVSMSGCASTGDVRSDQAKTQHEVIVTKKQVVILATEAVPEHVVNTTETVERWMDEKTKIETHDEKHQAPDLPAAEKVISAGAQGFGTGGPIGGAIGLIMGGLAAWKAIQPLVKTKDQQLEERDKRLERLRIDRDEARALADERALKLPPT